MSSASTIVRTPLYAMSVEQLRFISADDLEPQARRDLARELLYEREAESWNRPWRIPELPPEFDAHHETGTE